MICSNLIHTVSRATPWLCGVMALLSVLIFSAPARAQTQFACTAGPSSGIDVTTYHNDSQRTGWNKQETALRPCNVNPRSFGLLYDPVRLNAQVDAQPLVVTNQEVETSQGNRSRYNVVVYIVTASNAVYAIDGLTGAVLRQTTLGTPVDESRLPDCGNNAPSVGISSTPVIDRNTGTIYVVAYLLEDDRSVYRIFALDLADLSLKVKPAPLISASHDLLDGSKYEFDPTVSRQRAGLLLANGNVYAAFASFCDHKQDLSRGWVLGWQASSLTPLRPSHLSDRRLETNSLHNDDPRFRRNFFLSSIWMSGYGIAADDEDGGQSDLYFITGNSDAKGPFQIDPNANLQESVVRMRADLAGVVDYFTPSDPQYGLQKLEVRDLDFGAGGVLLIPGKQPGSNKRVAIAAGKVGQMYLLDRDDMGKYDPTGTNHVLDTVDIGQCWCGQSYFTGSDGIGRIVSSGDPHVKVWRITNTSSPKLALDYSSSVDLSAGAFQKGFFTSVSSDGQKPDTAIIWAVRRPTDTMTFTLMLYAFNAADGTLLYSAPAGTWRWYQQAAANVVPTIANGRVFVASNGELRAFGLGGQTVASAAAAAVALPAAPPGTYAGWVIRVVEGTNSFWLNTSQHGVLEVDTTRALAAGLDVHLEPGQPVTVRGSMVGNVVDARSIYYGLSTR
jgi:hypothetical protein